MRCLPISLLLWLVWTCHGAALGNPGATAALKPVAGGSAPAAPSGLMVTSVDVGGLGATLGWTDNSSTETAFRVQYSYNSGVFADVAFDVCGSEANPTAANVVTYIAGCDGTPSFGGNSAEYSFLRYRVRAENGFGNSAYSAIVQVPPSVAVTDLAALINVLNVEVSWTDTGENETEVRVYRSTNAGMSYSLLSTEAAGTGTYTDTGALVSHMAANLRYYTARVNAGGVGPNSNAAMPVP